MSAISAAHRLCGCGRRHLNTKPRPAFDRLAMAPQSQSPLSSRRSAFGSRGASSLRKGSLSETRRKTMAPTLHTSEAIRYSPPRMTSGAAVLVVPAALTPVRDVSRDRVKTRDLRVH